jgi:hypothetical protein
MSSFTLDVTLISQETDVSSRSKGKVMLEAFFNSQVTHHSPGAVHSRKAQCQHKTYRETFFATCH